MSPKLDLTLSAPLSWASECSSIFPLYFQFSASCRNEWKLLQFTHIGLRFLSPCELYELTEQLPKLLEMVNVTSEVDKFKTEYPFVCPKCGSRMMTTISYTADMKTRMCSYQISDAGYVPTVIRSNFQTPLIPQTTVLWPLYSCSCSWYHPLNFSIIFVFTFSTALQKKKKRRWMDGSYYGLPVLVWDKVLSFLTPHNLYKLT